MGNQPDVARVPLFANYADIPSKMDIVLANLFPQDDTVGHTTVG